MSDQEACNPCTNNEKRLKEFPGPWDGEPHRIEFEHAGLPCILHRGPVGVWCGYVAVLPGHPLHGQDYDKADVDVHSGLTYANRCEGHICHDAQPGSPDDVWWFGFDCGHMLDRVPLLDEYKSRLGFFAEEVSGPHSHYWTMAEVRAETEHLAEQLAALCA